MSDTIRILVIDDSEDDRDLYRRALQKSPLAKYEVADAEDGDRGLARIQERVPDCILLDYSLPGRNGIDVLKRIHAEHPFIPVVMLTGQGNETVAVTAMREGAQNYLVKSTITPDTIHRAIQVAIEHRGMERRIDEQRKSLEIFTRALAHDLKEPIRTIKSFLGLLSTEERFSEKGRRYFDHVRKAADRMGSLIDTVHFYTRLDGSPEDIPKEACSVSAVLEEAKENLAELLREEKPKITTGTLPWVTVNRMQLLQVLQNLICNALQHGGSEPRVHLDAEEDGPLWRIRVSDSGSGIPESDRERIFEPFTRLATEKTQGLGMGLAVCRRIIEAHGGTIRSEAGKNGGASFVFTLPKAEIPANAVSAQDEAGPSKRNGDTLLANVLLVDDNEADLELTQIMLGEKAKLKCNFLLAQDAYEALDVLRERPNQDGKVDLMLLDINMPGMSGLELLRRIRNDDLLKDVPVVICSTSVYDRDVSRATELKAIGYIQKPTEMTKLEPLLVKIASLRLSASDGGNLLLRAA